MAEVGLSAMCFCKYLWPFCRSSFVLRLVCHEFRHACATCTGVELSDIMSRLALLANYPIIFALQYSGLAHVLQETYRIPFCG